MEAVRYFYSPDGTEAHGPVTQDELRQLFRDQVIGPASYLCREGETEWQPLNPQLFQPAAAAAAPPPVVPPPFVPPPPVPSYAAPPPSNNSGESGLVATILNIIGGIVALGGAIVSAILSGFHHGAGTDAISYQIGSFVGALFVIFLIPHLISRLFRGSGRVIARTVGICFLALASIVGQVGQMDLTGEKLKASADAMTEKMNADARKQIAAKGYWDGNTAQAEQNMQALRAQATGDSVTARVARDMLAVSDQLLVKVKASDAAEAACEFKVSTIGSLDDIAQRRASIVKLRGTQSDVVAFLQNFDANCRAAMAHDDLSDEAIEGALAGAHKSGHIDLVIQLWQLKIKLSDDYIARLDFLQKAFGSWTPKDGKIIFQDDADVTTFNNFGTNLQDDVKELGAVQKQIVQ